MSGPSYSADDKEVSLKEVDAAGFPRINAFTSSAWTPQLLSAFLKKEGAVVAGPYKHFTPLQVEAIFASVSAVNSCEYCLTFHAMGMKNHGVSDEDIDAIVHQSLPTNKDLLGPVYASKLAASHKGPLLVREKEYMLKEFGYGPEHLAELIYLVGQISGNNMLMVHMISEGMPVDEMLQPFSPFKKTSYGL